MGSRPVDGEGWGGEHIHIKEKPERQAFRKGERINNTGGKVEEKLTLRARI
jgi:hypothetical protein